MIRAIRKRYFDRSRPDIFDHTRVCARRAAFTARSTSSAEASLTSARTSSLAGEMVLNDVPPTGSTNSPLMNRPYDDLMSTIARDSGAGAYSNGPVVELVETMISPG
jgi:hypothetical protein